MLDLPRLRDALDRRRLPVTVFFRDDDGGWADERLTRLVERFRGHGLPLDIALIPQAMTTRSVETITQAWIRSAGRIHLHQHGYSHTNHQLRGRASEFGSARAPDAQFDDLVRGRALLQDRFGDLSEPVFTPPWNRCTQATATALEQIGFVAFSRIIGSDVLESDELVEVPVSIDWLKKRDGKRLDRQRFSHYAAPLLEHAQVVGVMLHHEWMPDDDLDDLDALLELLIRTPGVTFSHLSALAAAARRQPERDVSCG